MKIKRNVINTYIELCPVSTNKCESYAEIEYKVTRAVELGQVVEIKNGEFVIGYYHLRFVVKNNRVIHMFKDKNNKLIKVSERVKDEYDRVHMKMVV